MLHAGRTREAVSTYDAMLRQRRGVPWNEMRDARRKAAAPTLQSRGVDAAKGGGDNWFRLRRGMVESTVGFLHREWANQHAWPKALPRLFGHHPCVPPSIHPQPSRRAC